MYDRDDPPLDLAAQAAAILWVMINQELSGPEAQQVRKAVDAALALGGIPSLNLLLERVARGDTARGQVKSRPQGTLAEIQAVATEIESLAEQIPSESDHLLAPDEYTVTALMQDLPLQRSARHQLHLQLRVLADGIQLGDTPVQAGAPATLYTVGDFETLPIISTRIWGSPDYWPHIAELNQLQYPYTVVPGQVLRIPHLHVGPREKD